MNLALMLFLSCNGTIPKTPAQKKKEQQAELKAEVEAFNRAAKREIKREQRAWYGLPFTPVARVLMQHYTPVRWKRLQGKVVWLELYHEKHYPQNYYDQTGTEK